MNVLVAMVLAASFPAPPEAGIDEAVAAARARFAADDLGATVVAARALAERHSRMRARIDSQEPTPEVERADAAVEATLRLLATSMANRSSTTRRAAARVAERAAATELYALYLERFPSSAQANELRFFSAEMLFALARFPEAAREYARVAQVDQAGRWREAAAEEAVRAWDSQRALERTAHPRGAGERAFTEAEREELAACARYRVAVPEGRMTEWCAWLEARIALDAGFTAVGIARLKDYLRAWPRAVAAPRAVELVLEDLDTRSDEGALRAFMAELRTNRLLMDNAAVRDVLDPPLGPDVEVTMTVGTPIAP